MPNPEFPTFSDRREQDPALDTYLGSGAKAYERLGGLPDQDTIPLPVVTDGTPPDSAESSLPQRRLDRWTLSGVAGKAALHSIPLPDTFVPDNGDPTRQYSVERGLIRLYYLTSTDGSGQPEHDAANAALYFPEKVDLALLERILEGLRRL